MKYGSARVSTDGQSVDAQVRQLTKAGCKKVFREVASGAKTHRAQLRQLLDQLDVGELITAYLSDVLSFAFDPDHAIIAYPLLVCKRLREQILAQPRSGVG
jgi:hypothetical protein